MAAGLPLVVRLLVPLWVVNATLLPITVGITNMAPPQQPRTPPDPSNPQRGLLDANAIKMQILESSGSSNARYHKNLHDRCYCMSFHGLHSFTCKPQTIHRRIEELAGAGCSCTS